MKSPAGSSGAFRCLPGKFRPFAGICQFSTVAPAGSLLNTLNLLQCSDLAVDENHFAAGDELRSASIPATGLHCNSRLVSAFSPRLIGR
jgi:hypothetical protein